MTRRGLRPVDLVALGVTLTLALALVDVPLGVGAWAPPWPDLVACVAFFWIVHRPGAVPPLLLLAVGVVRDLLSGGVLGAGALPLVLAGAVARAAAGPLGFATFPVRWVAFSLFAAVCLLGEWGLTGAARLSMPPVQPTVAQIVVTVLVYLPVSVAFRRLLRIGRT